MSQRLISGRQRADERTRMLVDERPMSVAHNDSTALARHRRADEAGLIEGAQPPGESP